MLIKPHLHRAHPLSWGIYHDSATPIPDIMPFNLFINQGHTHGVFLGEAAHLHSPTGRAVYANEVDAVLHTPFSTTAFFSSLLSN